MEAVNSIQLSKVVVLIPSLDPDEMMVRYCILRPPAATIPFWSGRFTEQNGRIVTIDYSLFLS